MYCQNTRLLHLKQCHLSHFMLKTALQTGDGSLWYLLEPILPLQAMMPKMSEKAGTIARYTYHFLSPTTASRIFCKQYTWESYLIKKQTSQLSRLAFVTIKQHHLGMKRLFQKCFTSAIERRSLVKIMLKKWSLKTFVKTLSWEKKAMPVQLLLDSWENVVKLLHKVTTGN